MTIAVPESEVRCKNPRCQTPLGTVGPRGFTPYGGNVRFDRTTRARCVKCFCEQRVYVPQVQK